MPSVLPDVDFFENGLCFICGVAKTELTELAEFHEKSEAAWDALDEKLQVRIQSKLAGVADEYRDEVIDSHAQRLSQAQFIFPNIHRRSLLVTLYAFLEHELGNIAEIVADSLDGDLKPSDLRDSGIIRARRYLTKVAGFNFTSLAREWELLVGIRDARNCIVHSGSNISNPSPALRKVIEELPGLRVGYRKQLIVDADFIPEMLHIFVEIFSKLGILVQQFIADAVSARKE